ncbi:MAG: hypothetical protein DMG37_07595 [Acidobacteria bacterium]|nr:MAG: hypothetical protein DMG37_07595 [Acidobacteriota bacterium]
MDRVEQAKGSFLIMESRRKFLTMLLASGVPLAVTGYTVHAQESQTKPPVKPPIKDEDPEEPKIDSKAMLEANQKDIKKNIERLYQLASELKTEVEKTDSVQVLSVVMVKKAEEIEKLAKGIRSRAIG